MSVIDLFSGCGGFSNGFIKCGFNVKRAIEFDSSISESYARNHPTVDMIVDDIKDINISKVFNKGDSDIIIGGPPCQGFSMAGGRIRSGFIDDPRNYLFKNYFEVVKKVKPTVFIMENVKGILSMKNGKIFNEILRAFSSEELLDNQSYTVYHRIVKAVDLGIPQKRERMIIIGTVRKDIDFELIWQKTKAEIAKDCPSYFRPVTVADAIGNLPLVTTDGYIDNPKPQTDYQKFLACDLATITNHTKAKHSKIAIEIMKKVRNGEDFTVLDEQIKSVYSGSYGRLSWDEQAPTITTRFDTPSGGRFTHPCENRTISPREAARIQSFSDDFTFYGNSVSIYKQIGNAIPPKMSYFLARVVYNILSQ